MARAPAFQAGYAGSIPVTRSMRAVVMEAMGEPLAAVDLPDPSPEPTEVIVAVDACGICGSDLHAAVHLPLDGTVLGHEFCGTVVATGRDATTFAPGSPVVGLSLVTCGVCEACRAGRIRKCAQASMVGFERPGAFAEFIALQKTKADSPKSWSVDVAAIDPKTFDLSVKNPNGGEEIAHRSPQEIMDEIAALDAESAEVLGNIKALL